MLRLGATFLISLITFHFSDSLSVRYTKPNLKNTKTNQTKIKTGTKIKNYMSLNLADGFDFPVGNKNDLGPYIGRFGLKRSGWSVTCGHCGKEKYGIYTGEIWDALESNTSELNEHVFALAKGKIIKIEINKATGGQAIMVEHAFLENGKFDTIYSVYKNLNPKNRATKHQIGDIIEKGKSIGSIGNMNENVPVFLHIELRKKSIKHLPIYFKQDTISTQWKEKHFEEVTNFIEDRRSLTHPCTEKKMLIAIKSKYKLYRIENGLIKDTIEIALGQSSKYHKVRQGDNRTPEGEYKLTQKAKGPFSGAVGPYFGERWIRLSYPNWYDAEKGYKNKVISLADKEKIQKAILNNHMPPKNTELGGGIGLHGWSGEWDVNGHRDITWGCISINNPDLVKLYDKVKVGDRIIISE